MDISLPELIERYNSLQSSSNYWIDGGMRLIEYLHKNGMRYREIYAIMEKESDEAAA